MKLKKEFSDFYQTIRIDSETNALREKREVLEDDIKSKLPGILANHGITVNKSDIRMIDQGSYKYHTTINFILEDTYAIEQQQIPASKRELPTVRISRNAGKRNGRHYSSKFIEATVDAVREFNQNIVVNVYATTNPMNTLHIARNAFASADRGNIKHLYVYQQSNREPRNFLSVYKIY